MNETIERVPLRLVVTIVDRDKTKEAMKLFKSLKFYWHYSISGQGTASSEMMEMLGLGSSDKSILFCIESITRVEGFLKSITEELKLNRKGNGIAFTIPISGVNHPIMKKVMEGLSEDIIEKIKEGVENYMETKKIEIKYSVIVGIINQGYSEEVMDTARSNGVRGGTVIHARRVGVEEAVKFLGISLQEEKELIMMLVSKDKKHEIMKELSKSHGIKSETGGVYLSLPVDEIAGMEL